MSEKLFSSNAMEQNQDCADTKNSFPAEMNSSSFEYGDSIMEKVREAGLLEPNPYWEKYCLLTNGKHQS